MQQLQALVKHYNLRWLFNPYATNPRQVNSQWRVGIDYNNATPENARAFDLAWQQLTTPIVEKVRKYSLAHKIKVAIKSKLNVHNY
jgi:hypothetical protein